MVRMDGATIGTLELSQRAALQTFSWGNTLHVEDTLSGQAYFDIQLAGGLMSILNNYSFAIVTTNTASYNSGIFCNLGSDLNAVARVIAAMQAPVGDCTIDLAFISFFKSISFSAVGSVVTLYETLQMWLEVYTMSPEIAVSIVDTSGVPKLTVRTDVLKG